MKKTAQKKFALGFTLIELVIVIAIIAILALIFMLIIDPFEVIRRSRDAARLTDLAALNQAITFSIPESTTSASGSPACNDSGINQSCVLRSSNFNSRATNGDGWVKVDLTVQKNVVLPVLPIDPINNPIYHYKYCGYGTDWKIMTKLESAKSPKMNTDGGDDPDAYEVGSRLTGISNCNLYD